MGEPPLGPGADLVVCADVGSTFTKAALVDVSQGRLLATTDHRTTYASDVMEGVDACVATLTATRPAAARAEVRLCSSAGGGLRIAVVGNEQLVTAEAGRRVALSSGGHVVHVAAGGSATAGLDRAALEAATPDVVLLVGGTDGGNAEVLMSCARSLAGIDLPVVVAGNADAGPDVTDVLGHAGTPHEVTANVMPRIGVLTPEPARAAIRAMFLRHVIGGKHLSEGSRFAELVRGATPDVVLSAVQLLATGHEDLSGAGDVAVVDVGGATTDVYSVVEPVEDEGRDVVGVSRANRTVEGDLGMRWSAPTTAATALDDGFGDLLPQRERDDVLRAATLRRDHPAYLPEDEQELALDHWLAASAITLALRRHAGRARVRFEADGPGRGRFLERSGVDLRELRVVVGSGGALRHAAHDGALVLSLVRNLLVRPGGWQVPEDSPWSIDASYVLAPAGLLAADHPRAAWSLLQRLVAPAP